MLKKILITVLFVLVSANAQIITTTKTTQMDGIGIGGTRQEAINNAIAEALGKLEGVKIAKQSFIDNKTETSAKDGNESKYVHNQKIENIIMGRVDGYEILSVDEKPNGNYEASVIITKSKTSKVYKPAGLDPKNRRAMVVVPVYTTENSFDVFGSQESALNIANKLTQELVNALTKTRKFTMLDREFNEAYADEKALLKSGDVNKDELLKLGNVLGTDYMLVSNISEFGIVEQRNTTKITGQTTVSTRAFITLQYRILTMATRQIKFSNTLSFEFEPYGKTYEQVYLDVLGVVANRVTDEVIDSIYPLKITETSANKEVILSQSIPIGTIYGVYSLGKKLYDPYTKEYLGQDEVLSGEIEIVRSTPKISYARVISGEAKKGDICRKIEGVTQQYANPIQQKEDSISHTQNGGVKLPFD